MALITRKKYSMRVGLFSVIREIRGKFFLFLQTAMIKITITIILSLLPAWLQAQPRDFRISAVQESQVWIEGGLLDGLFEGMQGDVFYEITVAGQSKRIVPARVMLYKVEDRQAIGTLKEQTGTVNVGYRAWISPRSPAADMLTLFQKRARDAFAGGDFNLAKQFYNRILEILPSDPLAALKVKECDAELEKLAALEREKKNLPYYRQAIEASMTEKSGETVKLVLAYVDKILAAAPGDPDALRYKKWAEEQGKIAVEAKPDRRIVAGTSEARQSSPPAPPTSGPPAQPGLLKDMILIPEADVLIGSEPENTPFANETPRRKVHVEAFYIDKYEVTNEDYKRFCDATGRAYPGYFKEGKYPEGKGRRPVVMVSWLDAEAYARWAGKRLVTEREWEAAAAGASGYTWPWGDAWNPNLANTRAAGSGETADAGGYPGDVSPSGVYDMAGNVSEWTADLYRPYPGNTRREKEYGQQFRVLRGGSFQVSKDFARSQFRARLPDSYRSTDLGFRCAVSRP